MSDHTVIAEIFQHNTQPPPQLVQVLNKQITLHNCYSLLFILDFKAIKSIKLNSIKEQPLAELQAISTPPQLNTNIAQLPDLETIRQITISKTDTNTKHKIEEMHKKYKTVFNKKLNNRYNGYYGHHTCNLNWSGDQHPEAHKVKQAN